MGTFKRENADEWTKRGEGCRKINIDPILSVAHIMGDCLLTARTALESYTPSQLALRAGLGILLVGV